MVSAGRIAKNTTYLTLAIIGQKILAFIYFTLIARMAGPESLGKYTFVLSFTTLFGVFVDVGLTPVLVREVAKAPHHAKKYLGNILTLKLSLGVLVYGLAFLVAYLLGHDRFTLQLIAIAGTIMVLDSFTLTLYGVFRALQRLGLEALGMFGSEVIVVAVGGFALYAGWPLHALIGAVLAGSVFNALLATFQLMRRGFIPKFHIDRPFLKITLITALPFALAVTFARLYGSIDTVILEHLSGSLAVGLYSVANKFAFALQFIPMAFIAAIYPAMSHYYAHSQEKLVATFENAMVTLCVFGAPVMFGISALAREIIMTFYGAEYLTSVFALQILTISLLFIFLQYPVGSLLNACDRQKINMTYMGITALINVGMNAVLIPMYQQNGAAVAFLTSYTFLFIAGMATARKTAPIPMGRLLWRLGRIVLAGASMGAIVIAVKTHVPFFVAIGVGVVVYVLAVFLVRGISLAEVRNLAKIVLRREGTPPETV